jgi:hypothetical protein
MPDGHKQFERATTTLLVTSGFIEMLRSAQHDSSKNVNVDAARIVES